VVRPVEIDDGVTDEVIRLLKSGKEATVYLVRSGAHTRCAKAYRDIKQQSLQSARVKIYIPLIAPRHIKGPLRALAHCPE
jgi:serine/threonine-protein kinase RIO1